MLSKKGFFNVEELSVSLPEIKEEEYTEEELQKSEPKRRTRARKKASSVSTSSTRKPSVSLHRSAEDLITFLNSTSSPLCEECGLHRQESIITPCMKPTGRGRLKILVVGEAPGREEDKVGKQFVGQSGQFLQQLFREVGVNFRTDCWIINAVNCRPIGSKGENLTPSPIHIHCCRPMLWNFIKEKQPKLIILVGEIPLRSVLGVSWHLDSDFSVSRWRGFVIPDRNYNTFILPTYHPAYYIRNRDPVVRLIMKQDIELGLKFLKKPFPKFKDEKECSVLLDSEKAAVVLKKLLKVASEKDILLAFDYETTGLKPYTEGHKVVCVSFCCSFDKGYAFMYEGASEEVKVLWKKVLRHPRIYKVAHNMKYEHIWSKVAIGAPVRKWYWDTMLTAHILDNRRGITSLKFQSYVHLGLSGYADVIKPYLKADNANAMNKVLDAAEEDLLLYNAIDSIATFRLALYQMAMFDPKELQRFYNTNTPVCKQLLNYVV